MATVSGVSRNLAKRRIIDRELDEAVEEALEVLAEEPEPAPEPTVADEAPTLGGE